MKSIDPIFMQYLTNTAASVREMGITKSAEIAKSFGADWVVTNYIPKVIENFKSPATPKDRTPVDPNKLLIDEIKKEFLNSKKNVDNLYATMASNTSPREVKK